MTEKLIFDLHISSQQYLRYYSGAASKVITRCHDGRRVQFPANILRPFIRHDGIQGRFELEFDEQGRCQSLQQIH